MASCRVENRAKKAQNGTVSASQLVKASQNAIFFSTQQISIVLLYCVQSLVGKGRFLATKRAQKRVCIVCPASAAILPFLVTSPDIQFWLSAALHKRSNTTVPACQAVFACLGTHTQSFLCFGFV